MLDIVQKRKIRSKMYHPVTLLLLLILVLFALHSTWSVYKKAKESGELRNISQKHTLELEERDKELKSKLDKLATVSGIEEEIRSKFSVAKDNENMVIIVPDENSKVSTTSPKKSFWAKIKSIFR